MFKTRVVVDRDFVIADIDRRIFGTFVEHMGRCVYTGIYEPGHPTADSEGFRGDVLELTRELGPTIIRYPGGNFLSGYDWRDGVGPKEQRPVRRDLAWLSTETNQFGTDEFMKWCEKAKVEPMFGVNLGTGGANEARQFIEYCNHASGSQLSDLRRSHGREKPYDIKFWCLGNEMDGFWQIGHKTATEYGRLALETAKVMRWVDPTIQLAACGSSNRMIPSYGSWEYEVLQHCFDEVDFISLHHYFRNDKDDMKEYLASSEVMDSFIHEIVSTVDAVAAKRRSRKQIMLSFDEWNVWYRTFNIEGTRKPGWPEAPRLLEETYNFEDALVVGGALITLMNNADRVKVACLAQLVNVIGPIMTEPGGEAWRQTIFYPFALASRHGHGCVMRTKVESPSYAAKSHPEVPYLLSCIVHNPVDDTTVIFAMNRHLEETMELNVELRGLGTERHLVSATEVHEPQLKAMNTRERPNAVTPRALENISIDGEKIKANLKPGSWNVIVTKSPKQ